MKIMTCIKQVPASNQVKVDQETGVLIRDGNNTKMNPYDLYAIETALQIKERANQAVVTSISMGPPSAKQVLTEALWMGSDDAVLVSDRKFAGADVVATSYTLSQAIASQGDVDLIICGKQTTDGDTAQVGPEMAEYLNIPHIPYVNEVIEINDQSIIVKSHYDQHEEIVEVTFPCLITVDKGIYTPRLPSYLRGKQFESYEIKTISMKDFDDQNESRYGLKGSPTQVERIFPPSEHTEHEKWIGSFHETSDQLYEKLKELKFI
ncbi:electron transfer flavoprotein subunit beta/FixA family protein [Haloplasma contractile]|uniref:Electron transfer flavoprotein small subunit n=1 Tax=Haloplasma contractile SSD-17B TaxID=1033810 RepID=F7PRE9_9MOLU|nr:electron transfer flavoprotein subunit beta/FixA family protein [Haloplasma contractile]ERJ11725.1 Electron-transferring flavoprotein small subunit [Haloplasma contractile SSD-17B]